MILVVQVGERWVKADGREIPVELDAVGRVSMGLDHGEYEVRDGASAR